MPAPCLVDRGSKLSLLGMLCYNVAGCSAVELATDDEIRADVEKGRQMGLLFWTRPLSFHRTQIEHPGLHRRAA